MIAFRTLGLVLCVRKRFVLYMTSYVRLSPQLLLLVRFSCCQCSLLSIDENKREKPVSQSAAFRFIHLWLCSGYIIIQPCLFAFCGLFGRTSLFVAYVYLCYKPDNIPFLSYVCYRSTIFVMYHRIRCDIGAPLSLFHKFQTLLVDFKRAYSIQIFGL